MSLKQAAFIGLMLNLVMAGIIFVLQVAGVI